MASSAIILTPYQFPRPRAATVKLPPIGVCIYCGKDSGEVSLTDEHIVPDGLGGDLVLPDSSCVECAKATSRAERHLLKEVVQFGRSVANVRSRKRKSARGSVTVQPEDGGAELEVPINDNTPFIWPFIISDQLPGVLRGAPEERQELLRLALFGPRDWNERGKRWLGKNGSFKWGNRLHPGIAGQAIAKMAHSYAVAVLGVDRFEPLLTDYILAPEPAFDSGHIGVYSSDGLGDALHYADLQVAYAPQQTVLGSMLAQFYVVYLRLFSYQPSPSILTVVGRPRGGLVAGLKTLDLKGFN